VSPALAARSRGPGPAVQSCGRVFRASHRRNCWRRAAGRIPAEISSILRRSKLRQPIRSRACGSRRSKGSRRNLGANLGRRSSGSRSTRMSASRVRRSIACAASCRSRARDGSRERIREADGAAWLALAARLERCEADARALGPAGGSRTKNDSRSAQKLRGSWKLVAAGGFGRQVSAGSATWRCWPRGFEPAHGGGAASRANPSGRLALLSGSSKRKDFALRGARQALPAAKVPEFARALRNRGETRWVPVRAPRYPWADAGGSRAGKKPQRRHARSRRSRCCSTKGVATACCRRNDGDREITRRPEALCDAR
jgi:hypothetical protein